MMNNHDAYTSLLNRLFKKHMSLCILYIKHLNGVCSHTLYENVLID